MNWRENIRLFLGLAPEHTHNWGKWEADQSGVIKHGDKVIGVALIQKRVCNDCGFVELNKQEKTVFD